MSVGTYVDNPSTTDATDLLACRCLQSPTMSTTARLEQGAGGMGHSSPRKAPHGSQPRGAIASVAGERICYREAGEGSPIVLIHGFPGNTFVWSRLMPRFVDHHRVIALDLPGLGYSHRDRNRSFALESVGATVIGLMGELGVDTNAGMSRWTWLDELRGASSRMQRESGHPLRAASKARSLARDSEAPMRKPSRTLLSRLHPTAHPPA